MPTATLPAGYVAIDDLRSSGSLSVLSPRSTWTVWRVDDADDLCRILRDGIRIDEHTRTTHGIAPATAAESTKSQEAGDATPLLTPNYPMICA